MFRRTTACTVLTFAAVLFCLMQAAAPAGAQAPDSAAPPAASPGDGIHSDGSIGMFHGPPAGSPACQPADTELFCKDRIDVQFMSGSQLAPSGLGPHTPTFDFLTEQIRLGRVLSSTLLDGTCVRGDFEGIFELTTGPVVDGFGSIVIGPSAMIRYNFVQPDARLIPYLQAGAGMVYTDAYKDQTQRAIGQSVEFLLEAGGGVHYRLGENWSLDVESELAHISNARLAPRNLGVNGVGASIGFTYFFK